jgi:hypothetical protein
MHMPSCLPLFSDHHSDTEMQVTTLFKDSHICLGSKEPRMHSFSCIASLDSMGCFGNELIWRHAGAGEKKPVWSVALDGLRKTLSSA